MTYDSMSIKVADIGPGEIVDEIVHCDNRTDASVGKRATGYIKR